MLFEQGVAALSRTRPDTQPVYGCPICRRCAPVVDPFRLEHVPPKSIGGKPLLLTCSDCNSTAGHEVDVHIREGVKETEIASGARTQRVTLSLAGSTITAHVRVKNGSLDFQGDPRLSDPKAHKEFFAALERASQEGNRDETVNMTWRSKHDPWRESVAWLRIGYLYAFAVLGYLYILRPELELIRDQIKNPQQRLAPHLVKQLQEAPAFNAIQFVFSPIEFRSIIVIHSGRVIVLPDFEHPSTFESRILEAPNETWPKELSGKQLPLPRRPLFALDFKPGLGRLISPDFA